MIPSRLAVYAFVLPALLSVVTIWELRYLVFVGALDLLIVLAALIDWFSSRSDTVSIRRETRSILSIGQPNPVRLHVSSRTDRLLRVSLRDDLPRGFECPEYPVELVLLPGVTEECVVHWTPARRGEFQLGDHFIRFPSKWGLWVRQLHIEDPCVVRVYPDLALIRTYEMLARQHRQYSLVKASPLRGGESEFARLRDYTTDDDYRFIDWKATARRHKLTAREFQLESDQNVFFALDAGRLMTAEVGGMTHFDQALNSALLMAHVASRGGDRVGLMCFDSEVRAFVSPEGGPRATSRLVRATYALQPQLVESAFSQAFSIFDSKMRQRSLLVLFTQLLDDTAVDELTARLRHVSKKHVALVVVLEDTDLLHTVLHGAPQRSARRQSGPIDDLYERGAAAELLRWKSQATKRLKHAGALVLQASSHELSTQLINRYLELKARHAL